MKTRKYPKAKLENKKGIFFQTGLIITLVLVFTAFEYKTYEKTSIPVFDRSANDIPEDLVLNTFQKPKPPPPPPDQPIELNIVDDNVEVDEDIFIDAVVDQETVIEKYVPEMEEEPEFADDIIIRVPEIFPEFPGGIGEMHKYLGKHVKYPEMARVRYVQGKVYIGFVVEKDGSISNVEVIRGIGSGCDEEAMRVVLSMPKWKPGKQMGRPVRVAFTLPIKFTLQQN